MANATPARGIVFGVKPSGEVVAASWYGEPPYWDNQANATLFCSYGGLTALAFEAEETGQIDAFFKAMQNVDEIGERA